MSLIMSFFIFGCCIAQNPIITHMRTADPSAHVWADGKVWLYCSHDQDDATDYSSMDGYHVFSSSDMVNWTDHGEVLHSRDVSWGGDGYMWAPDCAYKDGIYYLYYPHRKPTGQWLIGVATSDKPEGPFTDIGYPISGTSGIDPACFIDDDGQAYLYFGYYKVAKLKPNMIELAETPRTINYGASNFKEGAWMHKYNGKYYYSWSDWTDGQYQGHYSIGDTPYGPFVYQGAMFGNPPGAQNHHSMVEYKGQWYYFYHVGNYFDGTISGSANRRNVCIDYMYYNPDGTIQLVEITSEGVASTENVGIDQSATGLIASYSGAASWNPSSSTLTFETSGTINFTGKTNYKNHYWDVPSQVEYIKINENVTVVGAFHTRDDCTIEGVSRSSSIVYGTSEQSWAENRNLDEWEYCQFQNRGGVLTVKNLKALNPFSYFIRGWGTVCHAKDSDFIDDRGGWHNHSDGFSGGHGSTIDNCYFEVGDDAIKLYFNITVTNTTIKMIQNCVPFQFGWGTYQGSTSNLSNITIIGDWGRGSNCPVFQWKSGSDYKNVIISDISIVNPNASLFELQSSGTLDLDITSAYIDVDKYGTAVFAGTRNICGSTVQTNYYDCEQTSPGTPEVVIKVEAEDYSDMSGIQTETCAEGGENIGFIQGGDWAEYQIDIPKSGIYGIDFRVAGFGDESVERGQIVMLADGEPVVSKTIYGTGSWQSWQTFTSIGAFEAGEQTIRLEFEGTQSFLFNLNWFSLEFEQYRGDLNLNGKVDLLDFKVLANNWQQDGGYGYDDLEDIAAGWLLVNPPSFLGDAIAISVGLGDTINFNLTSEIVAPDFGILNFAKTQGEQWLNVTYEGICSGTPLNMGLHSFVIAVNDGVNPEVLVPFNVYVYDYINTDIGNVGIAGSADMVSDVWTIEASGADIWGTSDEFHFLYRPNEGDIELVAKIDSLSYTDSWAKAGVMIRSSLNANASNSFMCVSATNGSQLQKRTANGQMTTSTNVSGGAPRWVKLVRSGNAFSGYVSDNGSTWTLVSQDSIDMPSQVYVGVAVTSHNNSQLTTAQISNFSLIQN